jgi:hypothetical protein
VFAVFAVFGEFGARDTKNEEEGTRKDFVYLPTLAT